MRRWAWLAALLAAAAWDPVTKPDSDVADGNKLYGAGKFSDAESRYRTAEKRLAKEPAFHFDLGAALYKVAEGMPSGPPRDAQLDAAEKELRQALDAGEPRLRSSAHYNLGNTLFQRNKIGDAIEEYKRSLKLDPAREDARHNLELALRMKQQQQQKQQGQNQDQEKKQGQTQEAQPGEQQQQGGDQQQQQQQQSDAQKQQQEQQQQAGQQGQQQSQQPQQPEPQQANQQQGDDKKQDQQPPQDLSAEDEERKLDALERDSNQMRARRAHDEAREQRRGGQKVKDW